MSTTCPTGCTPEPTQQEKLMISLWSALLFILIASPFLFKFVNGLLGGSIASSDGLPNVYGLIVHGLVFFLIVYLSMGIQPKKN